MKPCGVLWMSFKYGTGGREANGRRFTDLDEADGETLLDAVGGLELIAMSVTGDVRPERNGGRWISLMCWRREM